MSSGFALDETSHFVIREWQDEAVVYDTASGDTHALDTLAYTVVRLVKAGVGTDRDLASAVASQFEATTEELAGLIPAVLSQLRRIGILIADQRESF